MQEMTTSERAEYQSLEAWTKIHFIKDNSALFVLF